MGACALKLPARHSVTSSAVLLNPNPSIAAALQPSDSNSSAAELSNSSSPCLSSPDQQQPATLLPTVYERKQLVRGLCPASLPLPDAIITLISHRFLDDSFSWMLKQEQLYNLRHSTSETDLALNSCIFIYRNIQFQLRLCRILKEDNDHGLQLSARLLSKHVIVTTTVALSCIETQCGYHNFVENFFESGWPSATLRLSDIDVSLHTVHFLCTFDILRIQPMHYNSNAPKTIGNINDSYSRIEPFYKTLRMPQNASIVWSLSNEMQPSYRTDNDDTSLILFYESPLFESNSYVLHFIQSDVAERDGFAVMLELFAYPIGVIKLNIRWSVVMDYNGKVIRKVSRDDFARSESCHSKAFSKSDFHFIGENVDFELGLLSIHVELEILEVFDEYEQPIEWIDVREWKEYGIFAVDEKDESFAQSDKVDQMVVCVDESSDDGDDEVKVSLAEGFRMTKWLEGIGMEGYADVLFAQGFDSLAIIREINSVEELDYVGIELKAHQIKLMNHINRLKQNEC